MRVYTRQRLRALPDVHVNGIRRGIQTSVAAVHADVDEPPRFGDARRIAEEQRVRHREDCGVRADAKGQRQRGGDGEHRIAAHHARAIRDVAPRIVDPCERSCLAVKFLRLLDAAKRDARSTARVLARHPAPLALVLEEVQVRGVISRASSCSARSRRTRFSNRSRNRRIAYSLVNSLSTRPASRRHRSACSPSICRPRLVIA